MTMIMIIFHVYIYIYIFFARVDEILWFDHSSEICEAAGSSAILVRTMKCILQHFTNKMFVLFFQKALSNIHSVRATISDRDPLTWTFNPKVTLLRLSTMMFVNETVLFTFSYCPQYTLFTRQNFERDLFSLPGYYTRCMCVGWVGGGGYSPKFYTGRLFPDVQPLTLIICHFWQKRYPFRIPFIDKWYPFHMHYLELCVPFNCCF